MFGRSLSVAEPFVRVSAQSFGLVMLRQRSEADSEVVACIPITFSAVNSRTGSERVITLRLTATSPTCAGAMQKKLRHSEQFLRRTINNVISTTYAEQLAV